MKDLLSVYRLDGTGYGVQNGYPEPQSPVYAQERKAVSNEQIISLGDGFGKY
jgi:hypothetical protein